MKKFWIAVLVVGVLIGGVLNEIEERSAEPPVWTESEVETTAPVTVVEESTEQETVSVPEATEPAEPGVPEISEKELRIIGNIIERHGDYTAEDIDLVRRDNDVLVDFEEYIVFMKDGEVIEINVRKDLVEER